MLTVNSNDGTTPSGNVRARLVRSLMRGTAPRRVTRPVFYRLAGCLMYVAVLTCSRFPDACAANAGTGDVAAADKFWKFDKTSDFYFGPSGLLVSVAPLGKELLFDPVTGRIRAWQAEDRKSLERYSGSVPADLLQYGTSTIAEINDGSGDCSSLQYADPPQIVRRNANGVVVDAFYILEKRIPPEHVHRALPSAADCRDDNHWEQMDRDYGAPLLVDIFALRDGSILLGALRDGISIKLKAFPTGSLTAAHQVFLIPTGKIAGQMREAGPSLTRRYQVFESAISTASEITESSLPNPTAPSPN